MRYPHFVVGENTNNGGKTNDALTVLTSAIGPISLPGAPMTTFCLSVQRVGEGALDSHQGEK
ncbi:hypothetical protein [Pontibacter ummariensis]|uniref:hypothetical protein n=1 Tax=Pontibacter ummariensis TaxID=1610492 RepID=UPI001186DA49|nr:hypothetical protein [Pontibacter ummariensis]